MGNLEVIPRFHLGNFFDDVIKIQAAPSSTGFFKNVKNAFLLLGNIA